MSEVKTAIPKIKVSLHLGYTLELGGYENMKFDLGLEEFCHPANRKEKLEDMKKFIQKELIEAVKEFKQTRGRF